MCQVFGLILGLGFQGLSAEVGLESAGCHLTSATRDTAKFAGQLMGSAACIGIAPFMA